MVQGRVMPKVSASWKASLPISLLVTWPVMATMGMESIMASTRPVVEVGGAGTGGGAADADLAGGARVAFGGEGGIFLVPHQDVADLVIVEDIVEGQGDAAGDSRKCNRRPPRARHSSSIFAPLINVDILGLPQRKSLENKKGHQPVYFSPLMAFRNLVPAG